MAITLTKNDIINVYDEIDRRVKMDINDGVFDERVIYPEYATTGDAVADCYKTMFQGMYGAIMAIVDNDNWCDITRWIDEIEADRYWWVQKY